MSTLRNRAIKLAHANPTLRPLLLRAIKAADDEEGEGDKTSRFTEGPEGKKEFDAWLKAQPKDVQDEWDANKDKYKDKFKSAAQALFVKAASTVFAKGKGCKAFPPGGMRDNCENPKGNFGGGKKKKKDDGDKKDGDDKLPEFLKKKKNNGDDDDDGKKKASLRNATIRLAHAKPHLRPLLLPLLAETKTAAKAKAPAKLKGKKLDKEINRLFRIHGDRVEFNIFDLSKVTKDVAAAYAAGDDMEEAMKKAVTKYRQN